MIMMKLKKHLRLGFNTFELFEPENDFAYPGAIWFGFCDTLRIEQKILLKFPYDARLFVNDKNIGLVGELFIEE